MFARLVRRLSATIAPVRRVSGLPATRLYAIGDVHGRLDLVDDLLARIANDLAERPIASAVVVFLGDLIDRGAASAGVLDRLHDLAPFPARLLFLLGNHEELLLRTLAAEPGIAQDWLDVGGDRCAESYGVAAASLQAMDEHGIADRLAAAIPPAHIAFLHSFGDTIRFGDYLLVHAGIRPGIPLDRQQPRDLHWIRQPFLSDPQDHGCIVIHGHTISDGVDRRSNRIGIDTGAYRTGILTAVVIEEDDIRFMATQA